MNDPTEPELIGCTVVRSGVLMLLAPLSARCSTAISTSFVARCHSALDVLVERGALKILDPAR